MGRAASEESDAMRIRAEGDRASAYTQRVKEVRAEGSHCAIAAKLQDTKTVLANLQRTAEQVDNDAGNLNAESDTVNAALEAENVPLRTIRECVELRKQRPTRELVRDEVEYEMQMLEKEHMETCALYQQTLFACSNELKRLDDTRGKLQYDVDHKEETIRLDSEVLGMATGSPMQAVPGKSNVLPYTWTGTSAELMSYAQDVCATAQRLTSKSANIRAARAGIEEEGRQRALAALSKRVHDTETLAVELQQRIAQVDADIEADGAEKVSLEQAIEDKKPALELAKTRLNARVSRPGMERVRDVAERALEAEVVDLQRSIEELALSRERIIANLARLTASRQQLAADLADKEVALKIDSQCVEKMDNIVY
jgi:hypothetical protein